MHIPQIWIIQDAWVLEKQGWTDLLNKLMPLAFVFIAKNIKQLCQLDIEEGKK